MKILRNRLWLIPIALAVGIFAVVQSLNSIASRNRDQVYQELQKLLGANTSFDGFEVTLWGGFGFAAKEFRIADNPLFAATPLFHATELRLGVSWWKLLLGKVVINSLTFENPELQIITNEEGHLNLSGLRSNKKDLGVIPKLQMAAPDRRHPAVMFLVTKIRLKNGRVDFFDRSIKEPAELQIRNIDTEITGLDPSEKTDFRLTAALTEGLRRDVKIRGQLGPMQPDRGWAQQPVDLQMQFDSLYVPMLARAMPFLRNEIPRELDVTGPMWLTARLTGSFAQPRLTDVALKVPLFGSSDYNAVLQGTMEVPQTRSWDQARVKGKLNVDPVSLTNLRRLPFLQQILPADLASEGSMSIYSQFDGSWERLRIGAFIKADKSELRYRDWFRKPAGTAARLRAQISRQKKGVVLHNSQLTVGNSKMTVAGLGEQTPESRLQFRLHSDPTKLTTWRPLISPLSFYGASGTVNWDIVFEKKLALADGWSIRGKLKLADAELRDKESGRRIDQLSATVLFLGKGARVQSASFRLGSSRMAVESDIKDLFQPKARYKLWSPVLNPSDLPILPAGHAMRIEGLTASGELHMQDGALSVQGSFASPQGSLQEIPYRDLRADMAWSPAGVRFQNLTMTTLMGNLRLDGSWLSSGERLKRLELSTQIESIDVQAVLKRTFPDLANRLEGQLNLRGRFYAGIQNGQVVQRDLQGSGETEINRGTIKGFNLFSQFFSKGTDSPGASKVSSLLPTSLGALLDQQDTPFETLKGSFTVEKERLWTENLLLSTPDYSITASGWVGLDGATKLNGSLVLAPRLTQELQRDYRMIRYLLDRRGRLAISFRAEGTLPNIKMRPENRALAQALRWQSSQKSNTPSSKEKE
jgi:hypothetical protein